MTLPGCITVGPLVLRPIIGIESGLKFNGEAKLVGELRYEFESTSYSFTYTDKEPVLTTTHHNLEGNRFFKLVRFEGKAYLGVYSEETMGLATVPQSLLEFGVSTESTNTIGLNTEVSFENKQLEVNPEFKVEREIGVGLYCRSELLENICGKDAKFGLFSKQTLTPLTIPLSRNSLIRSHKNKLLNNRKDQAYHKDFGRRLCSIQEFRQ